MIVDTSAFVAILTLEPEADAFTDAIARAEETLLSAATYVETAVVIDARRNPALSRAFDRFLERIKLVAATHVGVADEDLRHGAPAGELDHRVAL